MTDPTLVLRGSQSGQIVRGTPANKLAFDATGERVGGVPNAASGLTSFNGRTVPAVVPQAGDYNSHEIADASTVGGPSTEDSLDTLNAELAALAAEVAAGVVSVFGRAGAVVAALNDYAASLVKNDSTVAGGNVAAALNTLKAASGVVSVFGRAGAVVAALNDYAASLVNNDSGTGGATVKDALNVLKSPYVGTAYVDPGFVGTSTGSQSNPYVTIAAAFAALVAAGYVTGIVFVPPNSTIVENVVFPVAGNWEIACQSQNGYVNSAITGTVVVSTSATTRRALTNLNISGVVSGNAAAGSPRLKLTNCTLGSDLTLTGANWRLAIGGLTPSGPVGLGGSIGGNTSTPGAIYASNALFVGNVTVGVVSQFWACVSTGGFFTNGGATALQFYSGCDYQTAGVVTATTGTCSVQLDGSSATQFASRGVTVGAGVTVQTLNAQGSSRQVAANNVGSTNLGGKYPQSLCRCTATLTLLAAGTLGSAVLNVIYTDITGVLQTKPVTTPLNITAAVDTEVSGEFVFSQNGATAIAFSVTGIVTPGALSYSIGVAATQVN